jgi:hypothetical protein
MKLKVEQALMLWFHSIFQISGSQRFGTDKAKFKNLYKTPLGGSSLV